MGLENYLIDIKNVIHRRSLTRIRLSSHKLMIETGRYQKIALNNRLCYFCKTEVEDEIHFVVKCKTYCQLRREILNKCIYYNANFEYYSDKEKFVFLLTNQHLQTMVAEFCYLANQMRTSLMEYPDNHC